MGLYQSNACCILEAYNTKKHKTSNTRYLTCSLIKELKDKGQFFLYKCNLHLDKATRYK